MLTWARYADMVGTLVYMAPELMRREASSPASDVYSLAICLNEMLTGCVPYSDVRSKSRMLGDSLHLGRLFLSAHRRSAEPSSIYTSRSVLTRLHAALDRRTTTEQLHTVLEANYNEITLTSAISSSELRPNTLPE